MSFMEPAAAAPRVFISYARENDDHCKWVESLARRLRTEDNVDVVLDRWDAHPGDELTFFMERGTSDSRFVMLICTPGYKAKFDHRQGGVGYEAGILTGKLLAGRAGRWVIPIHRRGTWTEAAPDSICGRLYLDFTADPCAEASYRALVDTLHGRRELAPALGYGLAVFEGPGAAPALPVAHFLGREAELDTMESHLRASTDQALCVVAAGLGGVGKTALVRQFVATRAKDLFPDGAAWLDGQNLTSELDRVARRFGWHAEESPTPAQATQFLRAQLFDRCLLLVVDNLSVHENPAHVPLVGGKSRALITSRMGNLGQALDAPAETLRLQGWSAATCRAYVRKVVPRLMGESDPDLDALSAFVAGLPLAMLLLARALSHDVERSARDHLRRLELAPLGLLEQFAPGLDRGVAATFLDACSALSEDERVVLHALAACAPGTRKEIVAAVSSLDLVRVERSLNRLVALSLAEFTSGAEAPWSLHDVVRLFLRAQPEADLPAKAQFRWVQEHIRRHADPVEHEAMETGIPEALAAFERLLADGATAEAGVLLHPLYEHMGRRGRYALAVDLIERLLARCPDESIARAAWLDNLGQCHATLGDKRKAIEHHLRALAMHTKLGCREGEAQSLGNLGSCHRVLGDIPRAIECHLGSLAINESIANLVGQAVALGNVVLCYRGLGNVAKAIDCLNRSLAIEERLGRLEGQASDLGNLALCYRTMGDLPRAVSCHVRSLAAHVKLGSVEGQATDHINLGFCLRGMDDIGKAIEHFQRALVLNERLRSVEMSAHALGGLGACYLTAGDVPRAIDHLLRSMALHEQVGDLAGQAAQFGNLGCAYSLADDPRQARTHHQRALALFEQLDNPEGQAEQLANLALGFQDDRARAIEYLERASALLEGMGMPHDHPLVTVINSELTRMR
jgi:tetratricopeptide (TPR) repeat protein